MRSPVTIRHVAFPVLRRRLLAWFAKNGRSYPWRQTHSWFHLLAAEMMLRRTRADQVLGVYQRFVLRFPDAESTAGASESELDDLLRPLGMLWRQTQMRATLQHVRDHFGARAPRKDDDLEAIPGVGPYSRAMLRSRLFGAREAAVDVNVARLIARLYGLPLHAESRRDRRIIKLADRFVQTRDPFRLNVAMLDLCALVCKARRPLCELCPLQAECVTGQKQARRRK